MRCLWLGQKRPRQHAVALLWFMRRGLGGLASRGQIRQGSQYDFSNEVLVLPSEIAKTACKCLL